jgi:hypothetical protein
MPFLFQTKLTAQEVSYISDAKAQNSLISSSRFFVKTEATQEQVGMVGLRRVISKCRSVVSKAIIGGNKK